MIVLLILGIILGFIGIFTLMFGLMEDGFFVFAALILGVLSGTCLLVFAKKDHHTIKLRHQAIYQSLVAQGYNVTTDDIYARYEQLTIPGGSCGLTFGLEKINGQWKPTQPRPSVLGGGVTILTPQKVTQFAKVCA